MLITKKILCFVSADSVTVETTARAFTNSHACEIARKIGENVRESFKHMSALYKFLDCEIGATTLLIEEFSNSETDQIESQRAINLACQKLRYVVKIDTVRADTTVSDRERNLIRFTLRYTLVGESKK